MINDLQTRDKQNREVDSSEQYAVNVIGDRALQSADYVVKESRRALEKALAGKSRPRQFTDKNQWDASRALYRAGQAGNGKTPYSDVHTVENTPPPHQHPDTQRPSGPSRQPAEENRVTKTDVQHEVRTDTPQLISESETPVEMPTIFADELPAQWGKPDPKGSPDTAPIRAKTQNRKALSRDESRYNRAKKQAVPLPKKSYAEPETALHLKQTESSLRLNEEISLNTWQGNPLTGGIQNQGAALSTSYNSGAALQTFQAAGQSAGSAGASAAANTAAPGVGAAIQATEKAVTKIKETVENIAASAPHSSASWGTLAALFLFPLLLFIAVAGVFRGGGSASNVGLSADVLALMPQISAACQTHGIPEYAPLVAAVIMQESGGRVADVGGDVMQCAEGMGLPVGTPVSVEESISFGTSIIANNLRLAGAAGPTDIPAISLALQGYNFGNGYISWALARGGYSKENARKFSEMQAAAHGWSGYGDIDYVDHVLRYYQVSVGGMGDASAIADGRFAYPFPGHTWDTYSGHNGIDISFANCYGEPVYAVTVGTVRYTQDGWTPSHGVGGMWSFGNAVFIEHGDGWISAYGHLSALAVAPGEYVTQGQLIGYIGSTGNSTGPHLHLALYHNGDAGIGGQNFAELAWPQHYDSK